MTNVNDVILQSVVCSFSGIDFNAVTAYSYSPVPENIFKEVVTTSKKGLTSIRLKTQLDVNAAVKVATRILHDLALLQDITKKVHRTPLCPPHCPRTTLPRTTLPRTTLPRCSPLSRSLLPLPFPLPFPLSFPFLFSFQVGESRWMERQYGKQYSKQLGIEMEKKEAIATESKQKKKRARAMHEEEDEEVLSSAFASSSFSSSTPLCFTPHSAPTLTAPHSASDHPRSAPSSTPPFHIQMQQQS